jgi:hypothetical protein
MRVWKYGRRIDYFLAGFALALIMLSKLSAVTAAVGLIVAHTARARENGNNNVKSFLWRLFADPHVIWAALGCIIGNIVLNPLPFLYPGDLVFEIRRAAGYAYGTSEGLTFRGKLFTIQRHLEEMSTFVWRWMLPASILGLMASLRLRRSIPYWITISVFAALFFTVANVTTSNYKIFYWAPWLIPMSLLSGVGLNELLVQLSAHQYLKHLAAITVVILFVLEGLFLTNVFSTLTRRDTRQLAMDFIKENWSEGTRILMGSPISYSVPLQRNSASIVRARKLEGFSLKSWDWWLEQPSGERPGPSFDIYGPEMQQVIDTYADVYRIVESEDITYVIDVDYCWGSQKRPESDSSLEFPAISDQMRERWDLIDVFSPFEMQGCVGRIDDRTGLTDSGLLHRQKRPGPIILIYQIQ